MIKSKNMDIYFSCAITGGRQDQAVYAHIVHFLQSHHHHVLTAHLSNVDILKTESQADAAQVYQRDVDWVQQCHALVAEVSTPSHGVGYEIALALQMQKPVLCCYRAGCKVSKMILGNPHPALFICQYNDPSNLEGDLQDFLLSI